MDVQDQKTGCSGILQKLIAYGEKARALKVFEKVIEKYTGKGYPSRSRNSAYHQYRGLVKNSTFGDGETFYLSSIFMRSCIR
ncbi:MAG: hypothetical protein C4576_21175 [Desulfobacteraceae bacterium]|nr:MAG: hypothetical protein C4576_21175 [Desulfobacteraceae bacterium]